jgi:hypothetical protein
MPTVESKTLREIFGNFGRCLEFRNHKVPYIEYQADRY